MARGLRSTAEVIEHDEGDVPRQAVEQLREVGDYLAELGRVRQAGARVARDSAIWWFRSKHCSSPSLAATSPRRRVTHRLRVDRGS
jgi:argonaute-like protein implicated in RNA metabolism and viral defense